MKPQAERMGFNEMILRWRSTALFTCFIAVSAAGLAQEIGPMVGHVDASTAHLLIRRGSTPTTYRLRLTDNQRNETQTVEAIALEKNDFIAKFRIAGLNPNTTYRYQISVTDEGGQSKIIANRLDQRFTTRSITGDSGKATVSFLSCVDIEQNPIWKDLAGIRPDLLCLMGDTPYIDSSDLAFVRRRHREFLQMPGLADLIRSTPTVGTWDDHDFGRNNANGRNMAKGKSTTLRAFVEHRAHKQFGDGQHGVYHSVELGPIEVFLLDPRYFSQTEPSPVDATQPTCFGQKQWRWLLDALEQSKATFKILALGAIWQDKKNAETDDLFTYWYERDALFEFIKSNEISGVVLLGGDIHVSRHLVHKSRVNYDLHDFVVSPGHQRTITQLDVYHPSLRWSLVEGHQFLTMMANAELDDPELIVKFRQGGGKVNRTVKLLLSELTPKTQSGIRDQLRAYWSFDNGFANKGQLAGRLDTIPHSGAIITTNGKHGNAVQFARDKKQFLNVAENPLDDNSQQHSFAMWFHPSNLPAHGTSERMFLLESSAEGKPSDRAAWHLSLGMRASSDPSLVNLELYTHTLVPASKPEAAPTARSQGGFDCLVSRKILRDWTHIVCTFDSKSLVLWLNGKMQVQHRLPVPGPASEFGGLIIGGHRAGSGRNFDGAIDEVAIWSRVINESEIRSLISGTIPEDN